MCPASGHTAKSYRRDAETQKLQNGDLRRARSDDRPNLVRLDQLTVVPVILAGGSGTRLWPLSRKMFPKQFVRFFGDDKPTFFGSTLGRLCRQPIFSAPIVVCNNDYRFLVRDEFERAGLQPRAIILEPLPRNTAAAIAVAAVYIEQHEPGATMAVMPSDHIVQDQSRFTKAISEAAAVAAEGKLVLFGVKPTEPHSGYGYIQMGNPLEGTAGSAFAIDAFVEKPDRLNAERFLSEGKYYWNSGMFVMRADTFLNELASLDSVVLEAARTAFSAATEDLGFLRLDRNALAEATDISVDRAVMEKTSAAVMLPLDCGWNDIGSWNSLWEISAPDELGNVVNGDAVLDFTTGCYVHSDKALVAALGVHDLVIVDTPDALLVANRSRAQDVSRIVDRLQQSNRREREQHIRNLRPWGHFESLSVGPRFQVKLLHIKPEAKLSMQMHHHRSEHWTVVQGTAKVTIGNLDRLVCENESVYIPATHWHRLENPGKVPLEIIEVQIGNYLGEDDIIRADDVYLRSADETR